MRRLAIILALGTVVSAAPADAAGVGISLPALRALSVTPNGGTAAVSYGASVQVLGGDVSMGVLQVGLSLDYAYTRDFETATNYSFFDPMLSLGLPLGITPQLYVTPALEGHVLLTVASPAGLNAPALGWGPRLTLGYRPAANMAVELGVSYASFAQAPAQSGPATVKMGIVSLGGNYRF